MIAKPERCPKCLSKAIQISVTYVGNVATWRCRKCRQISETIARQEERIAELERLLAA